MVALIDPDPRLDDARMEEGEYFQPLPLGDDEHKTYTGSSLKSDVRWSISSTLMNNADLFAWTTTDILGVSPDVIIHCLSIYKEARPIAQKKRKLSEERGEAARKEAEKLLKVRFIRKAHYTTWLANVVMVQKSNGKWQMCVYYKDFNKA